MKIENSELKRLHARHPHGKEIDVPARGVRHRLARGGIFNFQSSIFIASSGQALVEFVIALVAIIVLVAGLLQIGLLGAAQSESMMQARRSAGQMAMQDVTLSALPEYIHDWDAGVDGSLYSADDDAIPGNPSDMAVRIHSHAHPVELDAAYPGNMLSSMVHAADPQFYFGLMQGRDVRQVPLFPAITHLVYAEEEITIRSEVWIPWTKGIY